MADLERLAKHGKHLLRMITSREHDIIHRLREIVTEVVVIVCAVSISIALHSLNEHRQQQQHVRTFLYGVQSDLARDVDQLQHLSQVYRKLDGQFQFLATLESQPPARQALDEALSAVDVSATFLPEKSRYEGFKFSGHLTNIENEQLLSDILTLYQVLYPLIQQAEGHWSTRQQALSTYLDQELAQGDDPATQLQVLRKPRARRQLARLASNPELYEHYQQYITLSGKISQAISAAYPQP
jgi:hypothetical protein